MRSVWIGFGLIGCSELPNVEVDRWAMGSCEVRDAPSRESFGLWSGALVFRQEVGGQSEADTFQSHMPTWSPELAELVGPTGLAPLQSLPSMGFFGDWAAYASPMNDRGLSLLPLWESGGNKGDSVFAFYTREADGPANELSVSGGEICETERSFEWRATVEYSWADLFEYNTYDYTEGSAPLARVQVHELLKIEGDDLVVVSIAEGELDDGRKLSMRSEGVLER